MIHAHITHHESTHDWCHLCGARRDFLADVWYANNAENDSEKDGRPKYVRICLVCAAAVAAAAKPLVTVDPAQAPVSAGTFLVLAGMYKIGSREREMFTRMAFEYTRAVAEAKVGPAS